ncbi:MAG: virulence RhuM family protein [Zoogloeaceae bacterium]|jgi:prophage maintenance system killer protein|nr:virulence RhuM family protein [Zoogloeaceae bacterium]
MTHDKQLETPPRGEVILYRSRNADITVEVRAEDGNVWLNRQQLSALFSRDVKTIGKHVNNALQEELCDIPTVAKFATVQKEGTREVVRQVEYYNIDMILSVGYRVKSTEGVYFRRWANTVLKNFLLKGAAINHKRLKELNKTIEILARSESPEISGISSVLQQYARGLTCLDDYDHKRLKKTSRPAKEKWRLTYDKARQLVDSMRFGAKSELFGREKDNLFKSALGTIYQTFGEEELYPSVQEKAANLLYLVVKNHAFIDGNKRIAAALFVYFLDKNNALRTKSGELLISNNALAAMTLMIALSQAEEKETMCLIVMNMLETPEN